MVIPNEFNISCQEISDFFDAALSFQVIASDLHCSCFEQTYTALLDLEIVGGGMAHSELVVHGTLRL